MLRKLKIPTLHGVINTPAFLPDATYGTISGVGFEELPAAGVNELVTTTLHLELKLGSDYIAKFGGLHKFFNYQRPILTDSGGYQVFSLVYRRPHPSNYLTENGAVFKDPETGTVFTLTPENSQEIQHKLGSDIRVVLDEPLALQADYDKNLASVIRTTNWAKRSKEKFLELTNISELNPIIIEKPETYRPLLGGVVQGAGDYDLRSRSAAELREIGFDMYNFGGLPLNAEGKLDLELSQHLLNQLPEDKPRYAMGIGTPDDIVALANMGWDLFDCVLPTRNGRHGYLYVPKGEGDADYDNYSVLHIKSERYKFSEEAISSNTHPALKGISRAYLRHLLKIGDPLAARLGSLNNLHFFGQVMENLRNQ